MKVNVDTRLRLKALCMFALEFYKVIMGTLLTVFVPHHCDTHLKTVCTIPQVASLVFEAESTNWWRTLAFAMNLVSAMSVVVLYMYELYREHWVIEHLDIDADKPNTNLDEEIESYPELKRRMHRLNAVYWRASTAVCVLVTVNFALSFVYLFQFYAGLNTLTAVVGYFVLVNLKLFTTQNTASASVKNERAFSAYMTTQKTFNTVDCDYVRGARTQQSAGAVQPHDVHVTI